VIAVLQRVREARVVIGGGVVGKIEAGLLVLLCAEQGDTEAQSDKLLAKLLKLRIFSDDAGKMNLSVQDMDGKGLAGGLLVVSQLYDYFVAQARLAHPIVQTGQFGADMQVHLVNDGPVTIPMRMAPEIK